ncbi:MAG: sugar kinase [Treponema sp.]|nr:sugar kinase [Treponema sp.]
MEKRFDFLGFGECLVRFSPHGNTRFEQADAMRLSTAGPELNYAVNLSELGLKTKWVSKGCDNWGGRYIRNKGREHNVNMDDYILVPYDGCGRRERNGICFVEIGVGNRGNTQLFDRGNSAFSKIEFNEFDWKRLLGETHWFGISGVTPAVSPQAAETAEKALKLAKEMGVSTCFDFNFRATMWNNEQAQEYTKKIIPYVDFIAGSEEDFVKRLGVKVDGGDESSSRLSRYEKAARKVCELYPNIKCVGSGFRNAKSGLLNDWQGVMLYEDKFYVSRQYDNVEIVDRTGAGDSFTAAIIYSLITGEFKEQEMVEFAAAYSALSHGHFGPWNWATKQEAIRVMKGGDARVIR